MSKTNMNYDKKSDILYIVLKKGMEDYAEEVSPFITVEYDKNNKPIGIEIFKASKVLGETLALKSITKSSQVAN